MNVRDGVQVSLEYTLTLGDGSVVESNVGDDPLTYVHGRGEIVPGLERGMTGMAVGDERDVAVAAEDGYGPVREEAVQEVPLDVIPDGARHAGAQLEGRTPDGDVFQARVAEIREDTAVVDFNHPLAGEALHFRVRVVAVDDAPDPDGEEE